MKDILAALRKSMEALRTKANAALTKLGPIEQIEAGQEVLAALNCMRWSEEDITRMLSFADEIDQKYPEAVAAEIQAKIAAGELVTKEVAEASIAAAKASAKQEIEEQVAAEKVAASKVEGRRKEIEKAHGVHAASVVPEALLAAENFEVVKTEFARRVTALSEIGVTAESVKDSFEALACSAVMPFDEAGNKAFDGQIAAIRISVGLKPGQKVTARAAASGKTGSAAAGQRQPALAGGGATEEAAAAGGAESPKVPAMF